MNGDFFTITQVSQITGFCEEHLRLLTRNGKLKSVKPNGGRIFVSKKDLTEFMGRKSR
ncbi:MAG: helix-turn-helix domain-containing protein [Clostridiaceae bacterium]|nr:helix-turn-helix domain-containing protein [Clostridiaceae bacterium]